MLPKSPDYAFDRCTNLTKVNILGNVNIIGIRAFSECRSLKTINIPISVKEVLIGAFNVCSSLDNVHYDGSNDMWISIHFDANNIFITTVTINQFREYPIIITISGKPIPGEKFDQPPIIENGRTLVPVRAVAEAFGCKVGWDAVANTVIIEDK